jgi:ligand-binding sensor domain-containing protein
MIVKVKFFIITLNLFVLLTTNVLAATPNTFSTLSNVNKIFQGESGFIWLAGQQGLIRVDGNENINFSLNNLEWPLLFNWIHDVYRIDDNLLIATENSGLWLFNTKKWSIRKNPGKYCESKLL